MLGNILCFFSVLALLKADFNLKLKYCSLKCGCESNTAETTQQSEKTQGPKGYYWRDFYGTVPADAYPLGDKNQYPQTFIGRVYDPSHNGTFLTTIVEGLDYVFNAFNGSLTKKTKHIQIMCTKQPKKLVWKTLTPENVGSFPEYIFVTAGVHLGHSKEYSIIKRTFFVVKTSKCKITYVGSATNLTDALEYAAIDGTLQTSDTKMFLLYKNKDEHNGTKNTKPKGKPFISHVYEYSVKAGSIIPNFYKELNIGSCSIICTNEGIVNRNKKKNKNENGNGNLISAMEYYWQPQDIFDKNDAFESGNDYQNETVYIGQAYSLGYNWFDVGQSKGTSVAISALKYISFESLDIQVFSTQNPERFEWVNTTFDNFASLDKSRMIPGGEMDNGTETFIGRISSGELVTPASVRFFESGLYYGYSYYGLSSNVQLLMFKSMH